MFNPGHGQRVTAAELSHRAIEAVREAVKAVPRAELPALLAELERVRAEALLDVSAGEPDRVLTPAEVAERLHRSPDWAYRNRHELPAVRLPGKRWGVPEAALERWIKRRSG